ncbi:c-type cytochrome biogenesis protein CcsB [Desertivibrio insolitus]|uniref:c-type cytochrome biogenesis protein CcsB n=1 Tax=Herbiconiux sp. SYSU D00978 TaxID=2812562 RepID=UPI0027DDC7BE|nr:c-type cytochrome biogenesis protein CcsB [Herbiconiux sp. SYSU D00978]
MTETLDSLSLVGVYSAMAVYTIAFICFTLDLAQRAAARTKVTKEASERVLVSAGTVPGRHPIGHAKPEASADAERSPISKLERVGFSLTALAFAVHLASVILRGIAASRVPWANMFEFAITATVIIIGVFLAVQVWRDLRFLGAYITGFATLALGVATVGFYVDVVPLPPALQSVWLVIHVLVAILGTAFFALGAALSVVQLVQARREGRGTAGPSWLQRVPDAETLENLAYRVNVVGFVFWTFTLIAGAVWAERAWGRYWGWDTKEVWTFVIWVLFAGYIHARATRGWRGNRAAWLAIVGFSAVIFNFTIVNLFFKGLHAYSGL